LKTFTASWDRANAVIGGITYLASSADCTEVATDLGLGMRHFGLGLNSGFMHGFMHSLRLYDQAVSVDMLQ
jgi:hypothetical protein